MANGFYEEAIKAYQNGDPTYVVRILDKLERGAVENIYNNRKDNLDFLDRVIDIAKKYNNRDLVDRCWALKDEFEAKKANSNGYPQYTVREKKGKTYSTFFILSTLFTILVGVVLSISCLYGAIAPAASQSAKYNEELSVYEKTTYDFRVYNPTDEQIEELRSHNTISKVFEYYSYGTVVMKGNNTYDTQAVFSQNQNDLSITAYNDSRLISGSAKAVDGDVLLDKSCANKLGVSIGDKVSARIKNAVTIEFTVRGIFEDNTFYENGSIYFPLVGEVKATVESSVEVLSLAGAMIEAKNTVECLDYLKGYKPLGRMLTRDNFSSNSEYESYKNGFLKKDYSSEIYKKAEVLAATKSSDKVQSYLSNSKSYLNGGIIAYVIVTLLVALKLVFAKTYAQKYAKVTKTIIPTKIFRVRFIIADIIMAIASAAIIMIGATMCINAYTVYAGFKSTVYVGYALAIACSTVALLAIEWLSASKINRKNYLG